MPRTEAQKLSAKKYYEKNKEKNKEKEKLRHKKYHNEHLEKRHQQANEWKKNNPMNGRISSWKYQGMIDADWSSVYEMFIAQTNCWICNKDFSECKKCLDHDHTIKDDDNLRYVCCQVCNQHIVG